MPKLSILNGQVIVGIDLSHKGAEVLDISDSDAQKLIAKTHYFDIETKELIAIPQPEPEPIPEPTEEELREQKIKEAEELVLRKLALQELEEDVSEVVSKIQNIKIKEVKKIQ